MQLRSRPLVRTPGLWLRDAFCTEGGDVRRRRIASLTSSWRRGGRQRGKLGSPSSSSSDRTMTFIVGCPRSGTTWVRSFFAAHQQAVSGQESHLFPTLYRPFSGNGRIAKRRAEAFDTYDRSACGEILGPHAGPHNWVGRERLSELLDEFVIDSRDDGEREVAAKTAFETIFEEYAVASGADPDTLLVEKTPGHLYYAHTILGWWPTARIIELIRDGRDVCVSLQHKSMVEDWAPAERADQINQWVRSVRHGIEARQHPIAQGRWLSINYEALWTDTAEQVQRLFAFAGLPTDGEVVETILAETKFSALPATGPRQHRRKGVVGDHQNHFSDADHQLFRELAGDVFEAAGYRF